MRSGAVIVESSEEEPALTRIRLEKLKFSRREVPALTVTTGLDADGGGLGNFIDVSTIGGQDWSLGLCTRGQANTDVDATHYMQSISLIRDGGLLTLDGAMRTGNVGPWGTLSIGAPAGAPLTINDAFGAVHVEGLAGPLWVSACGRITLLNTTGNVDARGAIVDFAGSRGTVVLEAKQEIDLKFTESRFEGALHAVAQRPVRILVAKSFETPFEATVRYRENFVCRAQLCSGVRQRETNGWYTFSYPGDGSGAAGHVSFQSEQATVIIDNWP